MNERSGASELPGSMANLPCGLHRMGLNSVVAVDRQRRPCEAGAIGVRTVKHKVGNYRLIFGCPDSVNSTDNFG